MSNVIDLTTLGAVGDMPPTDHPIYDGPVSQPSDISPTEMSPEEMALNIETLTARMGILEGKEWTRPSLTLVQVKPNTLRILLLALLLTLLAMRLAMLSAR